MSGLATVAQGELRGVALAGLGIVATDGLIGVAATPYRIEAPVVRGLLLSTYLKTRGLDGLAIGGYNRVRGVQVGVSIGVYNSARELHGVQIGLLNRADNNRPPFRYLPLVNAHFGR